MGNSWSGDEDRRSIERPDPVANLGQALADAAAAVTAAATDEERETAAKQASQIRGEIREAVARGDLHPSVTPWVSDKKAEPARDPEQIDLQARVWGNPVATAAQQWQMASDAHSRDPGSQFLRNQLKETSETLGAALDAQDTLRLPYQSAAEVVAEFDARPAHQVPQQAQQQAHNPRRVL